MRKGRDLIGTAVVAYDSGRRLGRVKDLVFDQEQNEVRALVLEEGGFFTHARILPLPNIQAVGRDAVIVPSGEAIVGVSDAPEVDRIMQRGNVLIDTKVVTTDGRYIGTLTDLFFDEESGEVEGFEISGGVFPDGYSGRAFVPALRTIVVGEEIAFAPPQVLEWMTEQVGAPEPDGAEEGMADTVPAIDPAEQRAFVLDRRVDRDVVTPDDQVLIARGERVTEWGADEAERLGMLEQLYYAAGGSLHDEIHRRRESPDMNLRAAKGRRAQHAVETVEGSLIVASGQIVTRRVIERAQRHGKEEELLEAVGLRMDEGRRRVTGVFTTINERLETSSEEAGDRLREGVKHSQNQFTNLWNDLRMRMQRNQRRQTQEQQEARIRRAVGRPVTRVILDQQDEVILNRGELITFGAIRRADEAGVLDILLESVYEKELEPPPVEQRAPRRGEASLQESRPEESETGTEPVDR